MFTTKSEVVGRTAVLSGDLVQSDGPKKFLKDGASQFQNFRVNLHRFLLSVLYEIITVRLGYHNKFCARWGRKIVTGAHITQRRLRLCFF
jgi:hypothetical protein